MRSIDSAENKLGVPPPKNTLLILRPQTLGVASSKSAIKASTYALSGISPFLWRLSCELKSQYGHFLTHHGMWIYKESGDELVKPERVLLPASGATVLIGALALRLTAGLKLPSALISIIFLIGIHQ